MEVKCRKYNFEMDLFWIIIFGIIVEFGKHMNSAIKTPKYRNRIDKKIYHSLL